MKVVTSLASLGALSIKKRYTPLGFIIPFRDQMYIFWSHLNLGEMKMSKNKNKKRHNYNEKGDKRKTTKDEQV